MIYKIGIVGFGVVGKSFVGLITAHPQTLANILKLSSQYIQFSIWDGRPLSQQEQTLAQTISATIFDNAHMPLEQFMMQHDYLFVSPGIDIYPFKNQWHKCLNELDLFAPLFNKPTIAITGSVGKTTTTKLLTKLLAHLKPASKALFGGNIGTGMLDLIDLQDTCNTAVLELSSFQLDLNKKFAPNIGIWTNWYPNHLDRHHTQEEYFTAKAKMFLFQSPEQYALLPADLLTGPAQEWAHTFIKNLKSNVIMCCPQPLDKNFFKLVPQEKFSAVWFEKNNLIKTNIEKNDITSSQQLCTLDGLPDVTFAQNWLYIMTALSLVGVDLNQIHTITHSSDIWDLSNHHRLEHFATVNGVDFYDDSKSTMIQATQAAIEKLATKNRPLIVILGGLGKGVDRMPLMHWLTEQKNIKQAICFGKECNLLPGAHKTCLTLEETVEHIFNYMRPGDIVLFSPSGTSFDLFTNYEHRGNVFQSLIKAKIES